MKITNNSVEIKKFADVNDSIIYAMKPTLKGIECDMPVIKSKAIPCGDIHLADITCEPGAERHIDIVPGKFTMEFNLGDTPIEVDRFVLFGFHKGAKDFALREFDLYFATEGDVFDEKNHYYHYVCEKEFERNKRKRHCDVMIEFDKPVKATKFGWKVAEFCPADNCARIGFIGIYSKEYSRINSVLYNRYQYNTLSADDIKISNDFDGKIASLVDNKGFDHNFVTLRDAEISVARKNPSETEVLYVAYEGDDNCISVLGKTAKVDNIEGSFKIAEIKLDKGDSVIFSVKGEAKLYEVGVYEVVRHITVTDEVINENFYGVGVNSLPMGLMKENRDIGYTEVHFEEEKRRNKLFRPAVARMWFQLDWFIIDEESYYKREYNYESEKMKSFFAYLDSFKESGTDVELNFGWKIDTHCQSWFSIPGVKDPQNSAPKDLVEFGHCCAKFLDDIINGMGYTNVKYLTLHNEVDHSTDKGDFQTSPPKDIPRQILDMDQVNYWCEMVKKVREGLEARGIGDIVEIWGPEASSWEIMQDWAKVFSEQFKGLHDVFTFHKYELNEYDITEISDTLVKNCDGTPIAITEIGVDPISKCWERSVIANIIIGANHKVSAFLYWMISTIMATTPLSFSVAGHGGDVWDILPRDPERVNYPFYDLVLFNRYVPSHSKVLKSNVPPLSGKKVNSTWAGDLALIDDSDLRVASFVTPENDIVIAVEAKGLDCERTLDIKLPDGKKRTFHKFSVGQYSDLDVPPMVPACERVVEAEGNLVDEIGGDYQLIVYTTAKPYEQIICDKGYVELKKGETFDITYKLYDTDASDVNFSVAKGEYAVSVEGNKIIAKSEGLAAVKVELSDSAEKSYDIVLVKVS